MNLLYLKDQLKTFFNEDIGFGDVTAEALLKEEQGKGIIIAKESGIFYGKEIIEEAFQLIDASLHILILKENGESLQPKDVIAEISGSGKSIMLAERVVLNLLQRLSGIATFTARACAELHGTNVQITDTRKTTPGLRMLEKEAVRAGGGKNHRSRLDAAILIKENHIEAAGSLTKAVALAKSYAGHMMKIEVEIENEAELHEAIAAAPDVIMFDNCTLEEAAAWRQHLPKGITSELSGGITLGKIREAAAAGIDCISMGALTHSAGAVDMSLIFKLQKEESL